MAITNDQYFDNALTLLARTAAGSALINQFQARNIRISRVQLDAHGRTVSTEHIEISNQLQASANLACVIGHELTHALDMIFKPQMNGSEPGGTLTDSAFIGLTEINAHFNQGLICRQLRTLADNANPINDAQLIVEMGNIAAGRSVFNYSLDWLTRDDVKSYLLTTAQYAPVLKNAINYNEAINLFIDLYWCDETEDYHCEENYNKDAKWTEAWARAH